MSAQNTIRVRKNLLGEYEPRTVQKEIRDLMQSNYYDTITLRPVYQRHIRWSKDAMNDFIGTIMNNGLVPGIIMYKLHTEDKVENNKNKEYEVVDGQHRLFTIKAFVDATYQYSTHINKAFIVYWNYEPNMPVFFKDTPNVQEWCQLNGKTPYFLTQEESNYFLRFSLNITTINSRVPLDQRREIFMSLQKGIPVRNSDLLKNKIDCKLIAFMSEESYEQMMLLDFITHCTKNAPKYWVNWVVRCFLLYLAFIEKRDKDVYKADSAFSISDKTIDKWIKTNHIFLNPTDDILSDFDDAFRSFILFLNNDKLIGIKFNPTQLFALFYWSCSGDESINDTVLSHLPFFAKEGYTKIKRNMWESNTEREPRKQYFNECLTQISNMVEFAEPIDENPISFSTRKQVWEKCIDGKCEICDGELTEETFEVGHIIARALGGQKGLDNLIPICVDCNRSMGIRNPYEYKNEVYPSLFST
jgi:hypothetical protein